MQDTINNTGIKALKRLRLNRTKKKYPNLPDYAIPNIKYSDRTTNGLTECIVDYINFIGGIAERRINTGRYLQPKTYTNCFGKEQQLQQGKWIKGTGLNGTADISGVYNGLPLSIEVKIGKDKMSEAQKLYRDRFEAAGGNHFIARSFEQFFNEFNKEFEL